MAEVSQLIIVNHSLLLANAVMGDNILPEFKYLVIDEAHHLEKVAENQFTMTINYFDLLNAIYKLSKKGKGVRGGLFDHLLKKSQTWPDLKEKEKSSFTEIIKIIEEQLTDCKICLTEFFEILTGFFADHWRKDHPYMQSIRILPSHRQDLSWSGLESAGENFIIKLDNISKKLMHLVESIELLAEEYGLEIYESLELEMVALKFRETAQTLNLVLVGDEEIHVSWVESKEGDFPLTVQLAPIGVREKLHDLVFATKNASILTSATLTVEGKFTHFIESTGLDLTEKPPISLKLDSPFNYRDKVLLGIATDLPDPGSADASIFIQEVAAALIKLIQATKGRTVVLFTSHYQLRQVYQRIKKPLHQEGIILYAQDISGNRTRILEEFKNKENSVLLGANSFWEGIDVVGDALSLVVIVKLPFWSPAIPTVAARLDRYKSQKKNGFRAYSLPQAIIRFRQGVGRLIRSHHDIGAICVLDKRIYQKNYGKSFLKSLPEMKQILATTDELAKSIQDWLFD